MHDSKVSMRHKEDVMEGISGLEKKAKLLKTTINSLLDDADKLANKAVASHRGLGTKV